MGAPPSVEQMTEMLSNPQFAQMMNEALQNPQLIDMMIQQNPQLRAMGPEARQILQSPQFRQMITNPQALQSMAQLSRSMGLNPFGDAAGAGGQSAFPAPGVTNTTATENRATENRETPGTQTQTGGSNQPNPFAALWGGADAGTANPLFPGLFNPALMNPRTQPPSNPSQTPSSPTRDSASPEGTPNPPFNPFAMLFNPAMTGQTPTGGNASNNPASPPPNPFLPENNPFLRDPAALRALLQATGGGAGPAPVAGGDNHTNPYQTLLSLLGGAEAAPPDNRPPEERYATQLRQLNEMGLFDFDRNIQALTRSGGDVNGALEWLFSHPS